MKTVKHACVILLIVFFIVPLYGPYSRGKSSSLLPAAGNENASATRHYSDYSEKWLAVKDFDEKGKPRSALEEVEKILLLARNGHNAPQIVKALVHRVKYLMTVGEKEHPDILRMLELEASAAGFPEKRILQSLLAEAYWNYFSANRWAFYHRTETANFREDDIAAWSLGKIMGRMIGLYNESISEAELLKKVPLGSMDDILVRGNTPREYRPTLYDFLAHRAVDFFMIDENQLTRPVDDFEIDSAAYFKPAEEFVKIAAASKDPSSLRFNAVRIFQELTRFHLADPASGPGALVDVELKRLRFARDKSVAADKDQLYIGALRLLEKRFGGHPSSALVSYEIAEWLRARGLEWKEGDPEEHRWSIKKSMEIAAGIVTRYPGSEGALLCAPLTLIEKSLSLMTEKVNVPNTPSRALVKYRNLDRVHLRAVRLSTDEYEDLGAGQESVEIKLARLVKMRPLHSWSVVLPDDGDLREHAVEVRIPSLDAGNYAILAGTDPSFSFKNNAAAFMPAVVSNISFVHRVSHKEGTIFYISRRDTGEPLADASAVITGKRYDYSKSRYVTSILGKFISDKNGSFVFPPDKENNYYYSSLSIALVKGTDRLKSDFYNYASGESSRNPRQTYFFTDRSIYRPGQTICFKAILLQLDGDRRYKILPDHDTVVELLDHNSQKSGEVKLRSNRYGTVSGSFTAPSGVLTGQMTIRNSSGAQAIRVEEYKRPKFEAGFEPVKGNYRLGESIAAKGFARSYSGAPLTDASVKYSVIRRVWFMYRWGGWYYRHYNGQETVIRKGEGRTDAKGGFLVNFEAQPDRRIPKSEQPAFSYEVRADVTDINGETHGAGTGITAGYVSLLVDIPGLQQSVDTTKKFELQLRTTNFSGETLPAKGTLSITRIKEPVRLLRPRLWEQPDRFVMTGTEYAGNFPNDIYKDEDLPENRGMEKRYFTAAFDTGRQTAVVPGDIGSWPDGDYLVEIETSDAYGEAIRWQRRISLYAPREGKSFRMRYLNIALLKDAIEPGENASILIESGAKGAFVLLDIVRQGTVSERKWVKLDGAKKIIAVPVREEDRGNIYYRYALIRDSRLHSGSGAIHVPWTNKELRAEFMTFRNRLKPGEKEEWRIRITGPRGEMAAAELVASMYDASLDSFYPHGWGFNVNPYFYLYEYWHTNSSFSIEQSREAANDWNRYVDSYSRYYDRLNLFGVYFYSRGRNYRYLKSANRGEMDYAAEEAEEKSSGKISGMADAAKKKDEPAPSPAGDKEQRISGGDDRKPSGEGTVQIRKNLNETAFFYPHLTTDEKGEVVISFTAPEALTRWKILGFAHTEDLKSTLFTNELVTQKELMVTPNVPRFLREGDTVVISSKITNMTDRELSGKAELRLFDAVTMKPLDRELSNRAKPAEFAIPGKGNAAVSWRITVPESIEAVTWRVTARAGNFSDGEESTIPVLSNRMMVTESMPLPVRGNQTRDFTFTKLVNSKSSETLSHFRLTLEFTSNPAWYAVQALPYLMEFPHECAEQVFSRFYSNSLASHIVNSSPKIRAVFDRWKESGALLSNLQKNEELKSVLIQETPWLLNGRNEEENKKRVALLFDLNRMAHELDRAFAKLSEMQGSNGGWPWFAGLPESWYITQHIIAGLAKLEALGVKGTSHDRITGMTAKAVSFIDLAIKRDYDNLVANRIQLAQKNIGYIHYHYLYSRSFYRDLPVAEGCKEAFNYWKGQAAKYWPKDGPYVKGLAAIALARFGDKKTPGEIIESLRETAIYNDELGMYWKENVGGYWWYQAPIETQALLIEAFEEVARDRRAADEMRTWLLKSKQTQQWSTTKATTDACYALLMGGSEWIKNNDLAEIFLNNEKVDPAAMGAQAESGTGYYKVSWNRNDIRPDMGRVRVVNKNSNPAWGALYWQYYERMDKITPHETPLRLEKKFFLVVSTDKGQALEPVTGTTRLKPGDRLKVRIILRVDRDMDYVHMKDLRAAGTEPENVLSGHRYQDGLWYYESTKDAATHFFMERLPKGTFVFEYPLMVNLKGDFSAGITTIQCMYAPEFTSHSEGLRMRIE
jgi:hypothetical protein